MQICHFFPVFLGIAYVLLVADPCDASIEKQSSAKIQTQGKKLDSKDHSIGIRRPRKLRSGCLKYCDSTGNGGTNNYGICRKEGYDFCNKEKKATCVKSTICVCYPNKYADLEKMKTECKETEDKKCKDGCKSPAIAYNCNGLCWCSMYVS